MNSLSLSYRLAPLLSFYNDAFGIISFLTHVVWYVIKQTKKTPVSVTSITVNGLLSLLIENPWSCLLIWKHWLNQLWGEKEKKKSKLGPNRTFSYNLCSTICLSSIKLYSHQCVCSPVDWDCRVHQLHLC